MESPKSIYYASPSPPAGTNNSDTVELKEEEESKDGINSATVVPPASVPATTPAFVPQQPTPPTPAFVSQQPTPTPASVSQQLTPLQDPLI
jgi:hypothetical protein